MAIGAPDESAGVSFTILTGLATEAVVVLFVGIAFLIAGVVLKGNRYGLAVAPPTMGPNPPPPSPPIHPTTPP